MSRREKKKARKQYQEDKRKGKKESKQCHERRKGKERRIRKKHQNIL